MTTTIFEDYLSKLYLPSIAWNDIIEIIILAFIIYKIMAWIKDTKAWTLLKGIVVILIFFFVAYILQLRTILWIGQRAIGVGVIAIVILFQPELRRALERLGRKKVFSVFKSGNSGYERFSKKTSDDIVAATFDMARDKLGALMVFEQEMNLDEFVKTGINIDAVVSRQLILNIFQKNTPLHDGAVIIREDRVLAATCYLPLSNNNTLSKELGTRHRAAVGVSEDNDSLTIVVSEETGEVSIAFAGKLERNIERSVLVERIEYFRTHRCESNSLIGK